MIVVMHVAELEDAILGFEAQAKETGTVEAAHHLTGRLTSSSSSQHRTKLRARRRRLEASNVFTPAPSLRQTQLQRKT